MGRRLVPASLLHWLLLRLLPPLLLVLVLQRHMMLRCCCLLLLLLLLLATAMTACQLIHRCFPLLRLLPGS